MPVEIELEDVVRLRKPHPCGGYEWRVVRLGADIGLRCTTCGRRVLLPRPEFERRLKAVISRADHQPAGQPAAGQPITERPARPGPRPSGS
jgi:hypothetical protein